MRLIDADELNLDYEVEMADDWKTAHEIANHVKYAPIAYDVDAVVKQIEEFVECNDECSKTFYQGRGCKACAYKEIIEIVKKGGVSNG